MKNPYFSLIATVWNYGAPWRRTIVGYYLALILSQVFLGVNPYAFGRTIDVLQNFAPGRLGEVIFWLAIGVILPILFWLFHGPARVAERQIALKIQQAFRLKLYEQLTHLPLKWHQDHHSGNIISRVNRSATALYRFAESQYIYIQSIVKFLTSIGFLLWISIPIGIISFVSSLIVMLTVILFDRKLIPLYNAQNEIENHVGAVLFDYISNQRLMSVWPFYKKDVVINEVKSIIKIIAHKLN